MPEEKIWVFGYGSLMWDHTSGASNFKRAVLVGWHREYNQLSSVSRGTRANPGLALGLEQGGECIGLMFQIPKNKFDNFLRREGVNSGNYLLLNSVDDESRIKIFTYGFARRRKRFREKCYVVVSNPDSPAYCGNETITQRAQRAISSSFAGGGRRGNSIEYINETYENVQNEMGIHDPALKEMKDEVQRLLDEGGQVQTSGNAVVNVEVYDSPGVYGRRAISNTDMLIGVPSEIRASLGLTGRWNANEKVIVKNGNRQVKVKLVQSDKRLASTGTCPADNPVNHCWMTRAVRNAIGIKLLPQNQRSHRVGLDAFRKKYTSVIIMKA